MFVILFILGGQAMMFITSKLGAIPEIVRSDKIASANGLINMASMSAIILGAVAGNWLADLTSPAGQTKWWLYAAALLGVAFCGLITSLFVEPLRAANPGAADSLEPRRPDRPRPPHPILEPLRVSGRLGKRILLGARLPLAAQHRSVCHEAPGHHRASAGRRAAGGADSRHRRRRAAGRGMFARQSRVGARPLRRAGNRLDFHALDRRARRRQAGTFPSASTA